MNEVKPLWSHDTSEHGGMFVDTDGDTVLVAVSPSFEQLDPDEAEAMGKALQRAASSARQARARLAAERLLATPVPATSASAMAVEGVRWGL